MNRGDVNSKQLCAPSRSRQPRPQPPLCRPPSCATWPGCPAGVPGTGWCGHVRVCESQPRAQRGQLTLERSSTVRTGGPTWDMVGDNDGMGITVCGGTAWRRCVSRAALCRAVPPGLRAGSACGGATGRGQGRTVVGCGGVGPPLRCGGGRHATRHVGGAGREAVGSRPAVVESRTRPSALSLLTVEPRVTRQSHTWPATARVRHPTRAACVQPPHCFAAWRPPAREAADAAPCET